MTYQWVATELLTGRVIADLRDVSVESIKQTIGRYETGTASLPLPTAPESWLRATKAGATVWNCLDMASPEPQGTPIWGAYLNRRPRNLADTVDVSYATLEQYLDRRYVRDVTYTQWPQNLIVKDLVERFAAAGSNGGIPIRVQVVGGAGVLRDRTYANADDKTLYAALQELSGVEGGPEWTVGWEWQHNPERITPVLFVGDRIGNPVTPGLAPNAVFEAPGGVVVAELMEDYSSDNAGNDFLATSTAAADVRPESVHVVVPDPDRPTFERRFTPSTSITDVGTLNSHAQQMAAVQGAGSSTLSLSAVVAAAPRLGTDWFIGDDIGYRIGGIVGDPRTKVVNDIYVDSFTDAYAATGTVLVNPDGVVSVPAFPAGLSGVARATGWQLDFGGDGPDMITPLIEGAA